MLLLEVVTLSGNVSVEELLSFIERGSATFFSVAPPKEPWNMTLDQVEILWTQHAES